ncbi:MAG: hypothetical protein JF586_06710 [Burkholderiales bacterium]|jgi:hypothetical protein|nr:hypothetical protein [Burkholderiales bacterium]
MVRSTRLAAGVVLAALAQIGNVQAQTVHKCIVNGAAVYQAAACPGANEQKSFVPAAPSQQELLDATANGRLQSVTPGSNAAQTMTPRRYDRHPAASAELTPSLQDPDPVPASSCDRLNQTYQDAKYRRDELSAPGAVANRAAALQRAIDDMRRAQDMAANTQCRLR